MRDGLIDVKPEPSVGKGIGWIGKKPMESIITCEKHGDYKGWTMEIEGVSIPSECPICFEEAEQADRMKREKEIAARQRKGIIDQARNRSCIPPKFQGMDFKSWIPSCEKAASIKQMLAEYVVNFADHASKGKSFLLIGASGTGKTHIATAIANNLISRQKTAIYVSALNFISQMKSAWNPTSEVSEDAIVEKLASFDLLVLDELGKGVYDAKEKGMIFRLIDRRYEENKPTIGISRLDEKRLESCIDDDAIRRLRTGGGSVIRFDWQPFE